MYNLSCLWESIHSLGYSREDVSVVLLVLEIVCDYEFMWDHGYLYLCILCYIHAIIEVKIPDVNSYV